MMQVADSSTQFPTSADHISTLEAARILGLAVRSVQLMGRLLPQTFLR